MSPCHLARYPSILPDLYVGPRPVLKASGVFHSTLVQGSKIYGTHVENSWKQNLLPLAEALLRRVWRIVGGFAAHIPHKGSGSLGVLPTHIYDPNTINRKVGRGDRISGQDWGAMGPAHNKWHGYFSV
jgi:hypothetical protein